MGLQGNRHAGSIRLRVLLFLSFLSTSLLAEVGCASLEAVKVSTTPILSKILYGKTDVDFQVLVSVEAAAGLEEETGVAPVDLVVVLDVVRSGRMGDVKAAMEFIIRKLDERDRLAIVDGESSTPELTHLSSAGRGTWREKVDRLKAGGGGRCAFFGAGLQKAVKILNAREAERQSRVGFIILLTDRDREESESETGTAGMAAHYYRYPVHILGLGASHDAMALLRVARESQGSYSFVEEEKKIAPAVAVCLGGLKTVVAAGVRIWLDTSGSGSDERGGVRLHRIDSGHHNHKISDTTTTGSVEVGVLYAGEVKNFLVHLRLPASLSSCCGGTAPLLRVSYDYTLAPDIPAAAGATKGRGLVVQMPELVQDRAAWQQDHPSHLVLHHIVQFRLNAMVDGFLHAATSSAHAHAMGDELQNQWDHFRRELQMWSRVDTRGMEPHVGAMVSSLRKSRTAGLAHVCSWVSTFQMQRPTSMGSTDMLATEFLTPAMKIMLEEAHRLPATANATPTLLPGCLDFHGIDHRLQLWSKFRAELPPLMFFDGEQEQDQPTAAVFRDASLQAIDRAMHHDIYLAVVHASKQRRCVSGLE